MQPYEIRRRPDGSIDYNNYHARPVALTTPALRRLFGRPSSFGRLVLVVVSIAAIAIVAMLTIGSSARSQCTAPASFLAE